MRGVLRRGEGVVFGVDFFVGVLLDGVAVAVAVAFAFAVDVLFVFGVVGIVCFLFMEGDLEGVVGLVVEEDMILSGGMSCSCSCSLDCGFFLERVDCFLRVMIGFVTMYALSSLVPVIVVLVTGDGVICLRTRGVGIISTPEDDGDDLITFGCCCGCGCGIFFFFPIIFPSWFSFWVVVVVLLLILFLVLFLEVLVLFLFLILFL